jgi:hypothetical protein
MGSESKRVRELCELLRVPVDAGRMPGALTTHPPTHAPIHRTLARFHPRHSPRWPAVVAKPVNPPPRHRRR